MTAFTEALAPSTTTSKRLNSLVVEVDDAVFLVRPNNSIQRTHSWAKFGRLQTHPNTSIICLIGMDPRAHAITVDHKQAVALMTTSIPSSMEITNCKNIDDFVNLSINMTATASTMAATAITATPPTARTTSATTTTANATVVPAIATTGRRITRRNTEAVTGAGTANTPTPSPAAAPIIQSAAPTSQTIEVTSAFIMAPFLYAAIFNKKTSDPLKLIILAQESAMEFDAHHQGAAGFANASALDHVAAFTNWALAIQLGKLTEARFTMDPNNDKLQVFSDFRHAKCILPPLGTIGDPGATGTSGHLEHKVFKCLGEGLKRMGEAADEANLLKCKEIKLQGDEDVKKKDRIKDMHPSIPNMILIASVVNHNIQGEYTQSFKAFYNRKNHGYVDMGLHHQFDAKGFHNVRFAEGTVLALWSGLLKRSNLTAPSNCTPFAFQELQPVNMNQKSRSLICTMINQKGGLAQNAEEIKTKAKQDVAAPGVYTEMIF
jgi:hypothetical protein